VTQTSDLSRFVGLGQLIEAQRPDKIISMGDFTAFNSISHWDKDKRLTMEGRRYAEEIRHSNIALDLIERPIKELQELQRRQKVRLYNPDLEFLEGNHEFWIYKYLEQNPSMEGHINLKRDLDLDRRGWRVTPYKEYLEINDILFTHIPMNGGQQAISGNDICQVASRYTSKSLIFGHTHRFETKNYRRLGANGVMQILTCGCFFETDDESSFNLNNWKGVLMLDVFASGRFEITTYSLDRLRGEV
jgi:predicted phosphodiesterase